MGRNLTEVDSALATLESKFDTQAEETKDPFRDFRHSISGISETVNTISRTQNSISKTVNDISITHNGVSKTVNGYSETINKHSKTINDHSTTINHISLTMSNISGTTSWLSGTAAAATASVAALTVGISLFKVDEKGITILGATREFKWTNKLIEKWQKKFESKKQKEDRQKKADAEALVERLRRDVDRIKDAVRNAGTATQTQRSLEANRSTRAGQGGTVRGVDTPAPTVRGVASDVRVLRSAVTELAAAFA
ncbi:hypothetical protein IFE09_21585 [Streptomyces microflavus]|uniref:hypothetical protein n=1 Tax=Streptomyces microflavus TaxID=1919 RepID=UPI00192C30A3|nr:hypothetical protein [Streptomyces microflavus]QQZ55901.1 hypothetical protein IFE09_21585 [Streptomyces microflavus]